MYKINKYYKIGSIISAAIYLLYFGHNILISIISLIVAYYCGNLCLKYMNENKKAMPNFFWSIGFYFGLIGVAGTYLYFKVKKN